jgi:hypothetical protein
MLNNPVFVFFLSVLHLQALGSTMANLNKLPDLSTVDIQAIQDSGPVHPRISLPPLTTIAENWDSVEPSSRNLTVNDESCSEDDDESEEEGQSHSSTPGKVQDRNSRRTSCSSSSSAPDSGTDSSETELSNATSDSAGSSSSSTDSDSDSQSSASSASSKSKNKIQQASVNNRSKASFSVREANYDKGRVTLRLSTLQLGRKEEITDIPLGKTGKISKHENTRTNVSCAKSRDSESLCSNSNNQLCSIINTTKSRPNQVKLYIFLLTQLCVFTFIIIFFFSFSRILQYLQSALGS